MKITDGKGVLDPQLTGPDGIRGERGGKTEGTTPAAGDRVSVSEAARDLARLRAQVGELDEGREDRVSELRAALAAGQYRVDPTAVARSVLRDLLSDQVR